MPEDPSFLSFRLPEEFMKEYKDRTVPWGFPIGAGNSLGELTFLTKYSRRKADGGKDFTGNSVISFVISNWMKHLMNQSNQDIGMNFHMHLLVRAKSNV
jgi:hypothetical protein